MMESMTKTPCSTVSKPNDTRPGSEFDSVSDVDREELNGGHRETDWRDARMDPTADPGGPRYGGQPQRGGGRPNQNETGASMKPQLEDGAD